MPDMLTVKEAAGRLRLSEKTVYAMIARGELPGYKYGKAVRVSEEDLTAFLESSRIKAPPVKEKTDIRTVRKNRTRRQVEESAAGYTGLSCLARFQS